MGLNLGKLETIDKKDHKSLANRIEEIITGAENPLFPTVSDQIEEQAQLFAKQISKQKIFSSTNGKPISKDIDNNYQNVAIDSLEQIESKDIGGEWLVKQAFNKLNLPSILESIGLDANQINIAQLLLKAKLIHPSSELETERWLNENSAVYELYDGVENISRNKLYKVASKMYNNKKDIDLALYNNSKNLFSDKKKIVIYDLTNMYFEGQMQASKKAEFGRSKQKRNDRQLIGLTSY